MKTNLLIALYNLLQHPVKDIIKYYSQSNNRINQVGEALEIYIKDIFCGTFGVVDLQKKNEIYSKYFSYLGNENNPPDFMIKKGDAVEVKKTGSKNNIQLNSSFPKDKLYANSPMITKACREAENWDIKDHLYCIGTTDSNNNLKTIWFIYGDCYVANKEIYERIKTAVSKSINQLDDIILSDTKELGRVNSVDPLGLTYLRIRGMWGITHPSLAFNYLSKNREQSSFSFNAILKEEKYLSFPQQDRILLESIQNNNFSITQIKIKNPNNPANLDSAILIHYSE